MHSVLTPFEAYCAMTRKISIPLRFAFFMRDKISGLFKVGAIYGFKGERPSSVPEVGSKLDFFTVEAVSDNQLVLISKDKHLAVMVSIDIILQIDGSSTKNRLRWLHITTSVKTYNWFGKIYMLPVVPAHKIIVKNMLRAVESSQNNP